MKTLESLFCDIIKDEIYLGTKLARQITGNLLQSFEWPKIEI